MSEALQQLRSLVVQSAETSRLLGVDFIPVYSSGVLGVELAAPEPVADVVDVTPVAPAAPPAQKLPSRGLESTGTPGPGAAALPAGPRQPRADAGASAKPVSLPRPAAAPAPVSRPPEPALIAPTGHVPLKGFDRAAADVAAARTADERAQVMQELRARYEADAPHQHFVTDHHSIVWGEGDLCAKLMFIGEAPGEEEDKTGRPFVGKAGQLLDKMIVGMGLKREDVYIANVLKTRPPGNATPTERESSLCAPYLLEQIAIVGPQVIVTLGLPATRVILQSMATMGSLRGTWATLTLPDSRTIDVMPTYHPAYVLRSYTEEVRGKVWSDLKLAKARLGLA
jgi:uracil-DNA glycosylase family 4